MVALLLVLLPPSADADDAEGMSDDEEVMVPDEDVTVVFRPFLARALAAAFLAGGFLPFLACGAGGTGTVAVAGFRAAVALCCCCCCCCWRCCAKAAARALCCC